MWVFLEHFMDPWYIIFKLGDKYLSKFLPLSWYGDIHFLQFLTLKRLRGNLIHPCCLSENVFSRKIVKPCFFVTFNIIISHIFPGNFTEIAQVVQKIWRFSPLILTIFINFSEFLTFPCCKKTNEITIKRMISEFSYF